MCFEANNSIRRRVNWRILPILALLYSFALIDRINVGAAYTAGMGADLVGVIFPVHAIQYWHRLSRDLERTTAWLLYRAFTLFLTYSCMLSTLFFVSLRTLKSTLRQLPGNLVLRKFGVRNWLTITILAWGTVQLGMGFVPTWGYLLLTRVLLGVCEVSNIHAAKKSSNNLLTLYRRLFSLPCYSLSRHGINDTRCSNG